MTDAVHPSPGESGEDGDKAGRLFRLAQFSTVRAVDGVFWISPSSEILYVNDAACRSLGFSRHELVGKMVPQIDPNFTAATWADHWADLCRRRTFTFESDQRTKDGHVINTEVCVNLIEHEGRQYNCAIVRDVTERKRGEAQLRRQLDQLRLLNQLTDTLSTSSSVEGMYAAALDAFHRAVDARRIAIVRQTLEAAPAARRGPPVAAGDR